MEQNVEYKLIYDSKGGMDGPKDQTVKGLEDFAVFSISEITPYRSGYVFSGWSYSDGGEADLFSGNSFAVKNPVTTIYAVWTKTEEMVDVESEAYEEQVEPLGVFSSSSQRSSGNVGFGVGMAFILGAVFLGALALILFRAREPKIITMEEVDKEK